MKRIHTILMVMCLLIVLNTSAQVQWGIRAGANFSNVLAKDEQGNKQSTSLLTGFHAGITADLNITRDFYIQPGLLFSTKGYKYSEAQGGIKAIGTEMPYYLEVPVNLLFKPQLGTGRLLAGVGPYISYGIGGSWKIAATEGSSSLSQKGKLNFKNDITGAYLDSTNGGGAFGIAETQTYGKPLDAGFSALLGYEFAQNFYFQANGQLGLLNITPTVKGISSGYVQKNRQFGVSVGYKF